MVLGDFYEVLKFYSNGYKTKKNERIFTIEDWIVSILSRIFA